MAKTRPPEKHFGAVWYTQSLLLFICALPLEFVGVEVWPAFTAWLGIFTFGFFLGPEWAAGGVRGGFTGTFTGWLFWKVTDRWPRVLLGLGFGLLMIWRFPTVWHFNLIFGVPFTLWLPVHYWRRGMLGPVDHFFIWLAKRLGIAKLIERVRRGG